MYGAVLYGNTNGNGNSNGNDIWNNYYIPESNRDENAVPVDYAVDYAAGPHGMQMETEKGMGGRFCFGLV